MNSEKSIKAVAGYAWSGCPRPDLIHIARVSGYHYKMNLHQVSTRKKFFYKSYKRILSKTAQPILMVEIYVIAGIKEVLKKIHEPTLLIGRG